MAFAVSATRALVVAVASNVPSSALSLPSTKAMVFPSCVTFASPMIGPGFRRRQKIHSMLMAGQYSFPSVMTNTDAVIVPSIMAVRMSPCTKPALLQNSRLPSKPSRIQPSSGRASMMRRPNKLERRQQTLPQCTRFFNCEYTFRRQ